MSVKWLGKLETEYPALAKTAKRLNAEDGFVMDGDGGRRGSTKERDGDDSRGKGKRKKTKRSKSKTGREHDEDGGDSGSGSSSHKRGRREGSEGSRERSVTPYLPNGSPMRSG